MSSFSEVILKNDLTRTLFAVPGGPLIKIFFMLLSTAMHIKAFFAGSMPITAENGRLRIPSDML